MGRKLLGYTAGLIGLYIVVANASNAGRLMTSGGSAGQGVIKTLQGR